MITKPTSLIASGQLESATVESLRTLNTRAQIRNPVMFVVFTGSIVTTILAMLAAMSPGDSFLDRMIGLVDDAQRQKTPNEIALAILLAALTIVFLLVGATLLPYSRFSVDAAGVGTPVILTVLVALLVYLIPTTIGGVLSAIGIAGMDRMLQHNVLATSGRAVEAADNVDVLMLDKTGTITLGNRQASRLIPANGVSARELAEAAQLASLADETPERRSIVVLTKEPHQLREHSFAVGEATFVPFAAETRMSGVNFNGRSIRKGASDSIERLVVAEGPRVLSLIQLEDIVKGGVKERFGELRQMGIKTVMITGDNSLTAATIAAEAGVNDFLAEAKPEAKPKLIRENQSGGRLVAMTGGGSNDAPALAQADVVVAMNSGTQAAKEADEILRHHSRGIRKHLSCAQSPERDGIGYTAACERAARQPLSPFTHGISENSIVMKIRIVSAALLFSASTLGAQTADTTTKIRLNGFVDTYYAYDFTRPLDGERRFTTQPVRHDEANVNFAWLGVTVERQKVRARIALQAGTSVQSNYAGEPRNGSTSGPDLSRMIQEAVVGAKLADNVWVDAGIYYSYIGLESWSSSDNMAYTRSLVGDFSPYYLSGVKLTWSLTSKLTAQFHVTNGWQNISENNRSKALGARFDYAASPTLTLSYANFLGNERLAGSSAALRVFNQVMAKGTLPGGTQWQGQVDVGTQDGSEWYGLVAIAKQPISSRVALVGRVERYADPDQVIIGTSTPEGFVGNGASAGVDVLLDAGFRWRSELRGIRTAAALFPEGAAARPTRTNGVLVTSLSFAF